MGRIVTLADVDYVGVLEDCFERFSVNFDGVPYALVTWYHIEQFSFFVIMCILIFDLINRISTICFFESENRYRTIFRMNAIKVSIFYIIEYHIKMTHHYIGIENLL